MCKLHLVLRPSYSLKEFSPSWFIAQFYAEKKKILHSVNLTSKIKDTEHAENIIRAITKTSKDVLLELSFASAMSLYTLIKEAHDNPNMNFPRLEIIVHYVIDGGSHMNETLLGLNQLIDQSANYMKIAIWLDETRANVSIQGKHFKDMRIYQRNSKRICAVIRSAHLNDILFRNNFIAMLERGMVFADTMKSKVFDLITKQRLVIIKRSIFEQIGASL